MASKGYTTADTVIAQLGRAITDAQKDHLTDLVIPAAEDWVDTNGSRVYGESVVVGERLLMSSPYTFLSKTPVTALTAIRGWYWGYQSSDEFTIDDNYYALVNPDIGQLYLPSWQQWEHLEADYTPDPTVPDSVKLATTMVCCVFMRTVLHPQTEWLTDYASAQDVRLKFRDLEMPSVVYDLIGASGGEVFVV